MEAIFFVWNEGILRPMLNSLMLLYVLLFNSFGLSILVFTIIVRAVTLPLTLRQLRQTRAMTQIQAKVKDLQKKYEKDRQGLAKEQMRLYKEHGVNPIGCLGPMFIQFPIWIGLYQSILRILPSTPESLAGLAGQLYSWLPMVHRSVPLDSTFLGMDLAIPQTEPFPILPLLVGISMWVQQKMTILPTADPRQAQQNNMMLWMMPLMLTIFSFQFPSGLALYWVASNLVGIVIQYFVTGWGTLGTMFKPRHTGEPAPASSVVTPATPAEEVESHGNPRADSQDSRRGGRTRPKAARRRTRGGRNRNR